MAREYQNCCIFKTWINISACHFLQVNSASSEVKLCIMFCARMQSGGGTEVTEVTSWPMGYKASKSSEQWPLSLIATCSNSKDDFFSLFLSLGKFLPTFLCRFSKPLSVHLTRGTRIVLCFSFSAGEIIWKLAWDFDSFRQDAQLQPVAHVILSGCCNVPQPSIDVYS